MADVTPRTIFVGDVGRTLEVLTNTDMSSGFTAENTFGRVLCPDKTTFDMELDSIVEGAVGLIRLEVPAEAITQKGLHIGQVIQVDEEEAPIWKSEFFDFYVDDSLEANEAP